MGKSRRFHSLLVAVCALALAVCAAGCAPAAPSSGKPSAATSNVDTSSVDTRTIDRIYVDFLSFGFNGPTFKIDFAKKEFSECPEPESGSWGRSADDLNPPDDVFTFVGKLSGDNIAAFLSAAREYGFLQWEEDYADPAASTDGTYCTVEIKFTDGTHRSTTCYYAYPATWSQMSNAFRALTGVEILNVSPSPAW